MVANSSEIKDLTHSQLFIGVNGAFDGYESEYFDGLVDDVAFFNYAKYTENFEPRKSAYVMIKMETNSL